MMRCRPGVPKLARDDGRRATLALLQNQTLLTGLPRFVHHS